MEGKAKREAKFGMARAKCMLLYAKNMPLHAKWVFVGTALRY